MKTVKMTVVTGKNGDLVAAHQGEAAPIDTGNVTTLPQFRAGLLAGPGQQIKVIEVPEDVLQMTSQVEFERHIKAALGKAG